MVMQLNIKDAETIRLARELAESSGGTITATIRRALEREYGEREDEVQEALRWMRDLGAEFRAGMPAEWHGMTSTEIMDAIYDEDGLPS